MKRIYLASLLAAASFSASATSIDISSVTNGAADVVASVANTVQQSGVERFAPPPQPKGCNAGYMWSTAGGIAHCVPIPPPPPVVTAPVWTPPTYDPGWSWEPSTGGGGSAPVASYTPDPGFQEWYNNFWNITPSTPSEAPPPSAGSSPPTYITTPDPLSPVPTYTYTPPPVVVAPAPPQEQYVWAIGAPNMGQSVGSYNGAAQYAAGEAYGAGQFAYVSQQYGNGDNVPYPVQTVSEFKASMAASGCWESYYGGWECR